MAATNGDLLQVAEYLYLRHDRQIGPIRHQIERSFSAKRADPLTSGAHVELANLGAGQIYTTNYDDIIEQTYRKLNLPVTPVILPKDVALADPDRTQVVKYHGDLSHERTLVLTESAYYKRLDFESPMDLKFRSDLLGKSVLFMGYSFRDINIRIIWFKLMDMMRDIPEADRRPSYIVRFEPNPALEDLYAAVGLKTIVLNPSGQVADDAERGKLMGEFLLSLSIRAHNSGRSGSGYAGKSSESFVSRALLDEMAERVDLLGNYPASGSPVFRYRGLVDSDDPLIVRLFGAVVPKPLSKRWQEVVVKLLPFVSSSALTSSLLGRLDDKGAVARVVIGILSTNGDPDIREGRLDLIGGNVSWSDVWSSRLNADEIVSILQTFDEEIRYQATRGADDDIAALADLANRIAHGQLVPEQSDEDNGEPATQVLMDLARQLVDIAATIYPAIKTLKPTNGPPELNVVRRQVRERSKNFEPVEVAASPFTSRLFSTRPRSQGRRPGRSPQNDQHSSNGR